LRNRSLYLCVLKLHLQYYKQFLCSNYFR